MAILQSYSNIQVRHFLKIFEVWSCTSTKWHTRYCVRNCHSFPSCIQVRTLIKQVQTITMKQEQHELTACFIIPRNQIQQQSSSSSCLRTTDGPARPRTWNASCRLCLCRLNIIVQLGRDRLLSRGEKLRRHRTEACERCEKRDDIILWYFRNKTSRSSDLVRVKVVANQHSWVMISLLFDLRIKHTFKSLQANLRVDVFGFEACIVSLRDEKRSSIASMSDNWSYDYR